MESVHGWEQATGTQQPVGSQKLPFEQMLPQKPVVVLHSSRGQGSTQETAGGVNMQQLPLHWLEAPH